MFYCKTEEAVRRANALEKDDLYSLR